MRTLVVLVLVAFETASCCSVAFAETATCASVGPSIIALQKGVNGAVLAAGNATIAASRLPGTKRTHNPDITIVEEQSAKVESDVGSVLSALGPLVSGEFGDPTLQNSTESVTLEARAESQEALSFGRLSRRFLQILETRAAAKQRVALANALRAFGAAFGASTVSNTQGSINGQSFSATTVTRTPNAPPPPITIPPDANIDQTAEALEQEQARLLFLPYTFNPLVEHWIAACRAAHQLPPAPTPTP